MPIEYTEATPDLLIVPVFAYGHETHWACNDRIEREGEMARCCDCFPHECKWE